MSEQREKLREALHRAAFERHIAWALTGNAQCDASAFELCKNTACVQDRLLSVEPARAGKADCTCNPSSTVHSMGCPSYDLPKEQPPQPQRQSALECILSEATKQVDSWPEWKRDYARRWQVQPQSGAHIPSADSSHLGPFLRCSCGWQEHLSGEESWEIHMKGLAASHPAGVELGELRALVENWRKWAGKVPTQAPSYVLQAIGWSQCADELEAALSKIAAPGNEAVMDAWDPIMAGRTNRESAKAQYTEHEPSCSYWTKNVCDCAEPPTPSQPLEEGRKE